jgi:hypothetical protein
MPGFANSVMYADNVQFNGSDSPASVTLNGQLLIGSTAAPNIRVATLTAGTGIAVTNGAGSITISATGGGVAWQSISASQTLVVNNGYFCVSPGGALSLLLPPVSSVGDEIEITLDGATSFAITQGAGQSIRLANTGTTTGVGGSITSTQQGDTIRMVCKTPNLAWNVLSIMGNPTVV